MKISEYPEASEFTEDMVAVVDGNNGTKKVGVEDAFLYAAELVMGINAHRNIARGKNLGSAITTEQIAAIQNGTFDDLYVKDYWDAGDIIWRIVDIDYWYGQGDTAFNDHHLVIMPDGYLYTAQMNSSNTTEGGYMNSLMYTSNLADARTIAKNFFGDYILTHREYLTNATTSGYPSGAEWTDSALDLPNEEMMYGSPIRQQMSHAGTSVTGTTVSKTQLSLMRLEPYYINPNRQTQWLRDIASTSAFASVSSRGTASSNSASNSNGVRPVFAVG